MRTSRLYLPDASSEGLVLNLPKASAHYLSKVLRLDAGAELQVFDGKGNEFIAVLEEVSKKSVSARLVKSVETAAESPVSIHIGLGLTRGERMDYAIQKATELGANSFTPIFTERCEVKLKGDRLEKRLEHWQQIAISACEQCGRATLPSVNAPVPLIEFLKKAEAPLKLILDHRQTSSLSSSIAPSEVIVLTGPEGGFTEFEIDQASAAGFQTVKLGNRVLRAETAPIAALSVLQWIWGDFQKGF